MNSLQLPLLYLRGRKLLRGDPTRWQRPASAVPVSLGNAAELFPHSSQSGGKRPQHQYFNGFNTIFPTFKINPWRGITWIKNHFLLLHLNIFELFLIKAAQSVCWTAFHTCWTYKSAQAEKWKWWFPSGLGQNSEAGWKERPKGKTWQFPGLTAVTQKWESPCSCSLEM